MFSQTDLYLDGIGGIDFELNRYYDSNEANLRHAIAEHVDESKRNTIQRAKVVSNGDITYMVWQAAGCMIFHGSRQ